MVLFIMLLAIFGCGSQEEVVEEKTEFTAVREVQAVPVQQQEMISYLNYSGKVEARKSVNIVPLLNAKITELYIQEGDEVKQGELLASLDDNQLRQLEIQFQALQKNYLRMQKLQRSGSIDQQSYEEVEAAYLAMQQSVENLRENTEILAPISGTISAINGQVGEIFNSMQQPYFIRIINRENMQVLLQLSQPDAQLVNPGMKAQVFAQNNRFISAAEVIFVAPEADRMSGTFAVKLQLNQKQALKHNQFVRVRLILQSRKDALVVPRLAVLQGEKVYVAKAGVVEERAVTLGLSNEEQHQIISGLKESEMVITVGNIGLKAGDAVKIMGKR
jgi:RND family efflux transporter MFP subunit